MKTLNLIYQQKSDIKYEIISFPDGEKQINILDSLLNQKEGISIVTRVKCSDDMFILLQVYDIFRRHGIKLDVRIKYLMSQRNDRLFSYGRAVSSDIIYGLLSSADKLTVFCPHNIEKALSYKATPSLFKQIYDDLHFENVRYFYPDINARDALGNEQSAYGEKKRNVDTGNIVDYKINIPTWWNECSFDNIVVVDDLCDGGYTFLLANEKLKERFPDKKMVLCVAHAVNEAGLRSVCSVYDSVITTNSYEDWETLKIENLKVIDV